MFVLVLETWGAYVPTHLIVRNQMTLQMHQKLALVIYYLTINTFIIKLFL